MRLSSKGLGLLLDAERIWCPSHLFQYCALFFSCALYAPETATAYSEAITPPSFLNKYKIQYNPVTIQIYCQVSIELRWECFVIILTVVLDLNGEQLLPLSVGHRHLIKASSSWGCHVVNSDDARGYVEFVSLLSTRPRQRDVVIVSLWRADVRCWRSQKGEREAVGNGVCSDVKGDRHRLLQETDNWNHCAAAPRFACFWQ